MIHQKHYLFACALATTVAIGLPAIAGEPAANSSTQVVPATSAAAGKPDAESSLNTSIHVADIPSFVKKGVEWLIAAQQKSGGWGSGSLGQDHEEIMRAFQERLGVAQDSERRPNFSSFAHPPTLDPQNVPTDPGTTAFVLLALLRAGHTPVDGQYKEQVRRGLAYLLAAVKNAPFNGPLITDPPQVRQQMRSGSNFNGPNVSTQFMGQYTQPQMKLGAYVDTPLTTQYLGRAFGLLAKDDPMYRRTSEALDKCLVKLQASQQGDGSWGMQTGWAPVLQSSLSCSALEIAQANGKKIFQKRLDLARNFQKKRVDALSGSREYESGSVYDGSAGVELYAFNAAFRGNASEARQAEAAMNEAKYLGKLPKEAKLTVETLKQLGFSEQKARVLLNAARQNTAQIDRLNDEKLLAGFGTNGGEEYLSYLLTSESLVIAGGDKFNEWNDKMHARLQKIQNSDGSWSGMHCITSSVFCTAAVVQCLTTDRDAHFLISMAEKAYSSDDKKADVAKNKLFQYHRTV